MAADFGCLKDGTACKLYTIRGNGITVKVSDYGASLVSLILSTKNGDVDVCLGYDSVSGYENGQFYIGCIVGRVCNRISKGKFSLDGKEYQLETNNGPNHLHGGYSGFSQRLWLLDSITPESVTLSITSPDGDQGYPGEVTSWVTYSVDPARPKLTITATAQTSASTPLMLTSHAYWNLGGQQSDTIEDHRLTINCSKCLLEDEDYLVTGEVLETEGHPTYDLQEGKVLKGPLSTIPGFDNFYFRQNPLEASMKEFARLSCSNTGIELILSANTAGLQFYSGHFLDEPDGKGGKHYGKGAGLCLETHGFPDVVNHPEWPPNILRPGEMYNNTTTYEFSTVDPANTGQ